MKDLGLSFCESDVNACIDYLCSMDEMKAAGEFAVPRLKEAMKAIFC